ncbi:hypothetical protein MUP79_06150, partial [Candidatus Bathyarchaeota archaeon]|nr:hypothetical protein [Candidatus Bathyarchaeota archaeon]
NGEWTLHEGHLVGDRMLDVVAFGPEYSVRYIRARAESEAGFDRNRLQNGVLEPLREADLIE